MQTKIYNSYRITHKDGTNEVINAENLIQALENMEITEEESPVIQTYMAAENIKTLVEDAPTEVLFTTVVTSGGSIGTPETGRIHVGDEISLKAIPARNYEFVSWSRNGKVISTEATFLYTMEPLEEGIDTCVFTPTFRLAPVSWSAEVVPPEATAEGSTAFPPEGVNEANAQIGLIAVAGEGYVFDHWERDGVTLTESKILETVAEPLHEGEDECIYKAVFTAE